MGNLTIMKKNLLLLFIFLLGLCVRLIFIDKPDGLWNDEYVSWAIASVPFGQGFVDAVKSQCHMPFYYLYLKFFMMFFGNADLILRLTSVFAGISAIPVMYFIGREFDEKCGVLCAAVTSVSSFLIYFSQEVRLYSVLFLFSALTVLYSLKFIKTQNKKNFLLCMFFNILVIFTHTIGFVFVFFNVLFICFNIEKNKKLLVRIFYFIIPFVVLLLPLILKIFTEKTFSQWWGNFTVSKIGFFFTDYFSPVLTNITNSPDNFFYAPSLLAFMLIPTVIAVISILYAIKNNKICRHLCCVAFLTVCVLIIAALLGKLVFLTKYSIEIYPILILLSCYGLGRIKNNILRYLFITVYFSISIGYILIHPYSAPKMHRAEGHKIVADMLSRMDLKTDDYIILEYYNAERFSKYFDFSDYRVVSINKVNFVKYMSPDVDYAQAYGNGKEIYKGLFLTDGNDYLSSKLQRNILNNLKDGQSVVLIILDSVAIYNPEQLKLISADSYIYNKTPLLYLVFSYLKKEVFLDLAKNLSISRIENKGNWTEIKFTKLNK